MCETTCGDGVVAETERRWEGTSERLTVRCPSWWSGKWMKRYSVATSCMMESPRNSILWLWPLEEGNSRKGGWGREEGGGNDVSGWSQHKAFDWTSTKSHQEKRRKNTSTTSTSSSTSSTSNSGSLLVLSLGCKATSCVSKSLTDPTELKISPGRCVRHQVRGREAGLRERQRAGRPTSKLSRRL